MIGWHGLVLQAVTLPARPGVPDRATRLFPDLSYVCPQRRLKVPSTGSEGLMMPSDINISVTDRAGRRCASSGSKWEPVMGYSRAVRSGNIIAVTGSVGINADGTYSPSLGEQ